MGSVTDQQWRRGMHRASQFAQFAVALGLPVAAFTVMPWTAMPAVAFSYRILRHLEDDQLVLKPEGLASRMLDETKVILARRYDRRDSRGLRR